MKILITDWSSFDQVFPLALKYQVGIEVLEFANRFEERFIGQGMDDRDILETLDLAWELLSELPVDLLKRIPQDMIQQYRR